MIERNKLTQEEEEGREKERGREAEAARERKTGNRILEGEVRETGNRCAWVQEAWTADQRRHRRQSGLRQRILRCVADKKSEKRSGGRHSKENHEAEVRVREAGVRLSEWM